MIGREGCQMCGGEGLIQVDDLNTRLCMCAYAKRMAEHLGPEISQTLNILSSPLYVRNEEGEPTDLTKQNVFIRGPWPELLPHFKFVLGLKGLQFRVLITTDEKLKTIWLGYESYKAKSRDERDQGDVINSLSDHITSANLVIIRLGHLGYKNIAMAGILKEALMHGQVARLPIWLVDEPDNPFQEGHLSHSWEVENYITTHFKTRLDLTGSIPALSNPAPMEFKKLGAPVETSTMVVEDYEPAPIEGQFEEDSSEVEAITLGSGKPKKKTFNKQGSWKKKVVRSSGDFEK